MNPKIFAAVIIVAVVLVPSYSIRGEISHSNIDMNAGGGGGGTLIRIALYDSISPSVNQMEKALNYEWNHGNYSMSVERIDGNNILAGELNRDNYDVLVIGASGRQYFQGVTEKWKSEVKDFIYGGGGYVGICGGANIVSRGIEHPRYFLDGVINRASLGIVDVYINDEQNEEWQYLWKDTGQDHIPVEVGIDRDSEIFSDYGRQRMYIVYGGGAGMYPAADGGTDDMKPIAFFIEEPMEVAPLHYWRWNGGWEIASNVTTDIKGQWAGIDTTYGEGRIIIFSPHPEIPPMMNGSISEFFGLSIYGIPRYVYSWGGGEQTNEDYNWWILRRSAALAAGVAEEDLPPSG